MNVNTEEGEAEAIAVQHLAECQHLVSRHQTSRWWKDTRDQLSVPAEGRVDVYGIQEFVLMSVDKPRGLPPCLVC